MVERNVAVVTRDSSRRIVFVIRSLGVGGAERQLIELATRLQARRWDVAIVTFYSGGALWSEALHRNISVRSLEKRGRWDVAGFLVRLIRELRRHNPAIIHSYLTDANVVTGVIKSFLRPSRIVWGVRQAAVDYSHYDSLAGLSFRLSCRLSRRADLVICNSTAAARHHIESGFPADRTLVVPNGIDTERFRPNEASRHRLRAEWKIEVGERLIGIIGRLDRLKGHDTFLRAAALFHRTDPSARFVCVGRGTPVDQNRLHGLADELGIAHRVLWIDFEDSAAVYNALDIMTLASTSESFPNVVGEAMATNTPCVVTDVGDARAIVGQAGIVIPPEDPAALAAAWSALASNQVQVCGGRARIEQTFSLEALASNTERALEPLFGLS
jgi:glycosyltransferase involved in cell wall biosynthesis